MVKDARDLAGAAFQPSGPADTTQVARAAFFAAWSGRAKGVADQAHPVEGGSRGLRPGRSRLGTTGLDLAARPRVD